MTCQQCGTREASVLLKKVEGGEVQELHLCEGCAAERGVSVAGDLVKDAMGALLAGLGGEEGGEGGLSSGAALSACPECGATLQDFRRTGRLGCGACWATFEGPLRGLVRRVHGASRHAGKYYVPPGEEPEDRSALARQLRERLAVAVQEEQFETAAELRDRLRGLE